MYNQYQYQDVTYVQAGGSSNYQAVGGLQPRYVQPSQLVQKAPMYIQQKPQLKLVQQPQYKIVQVQQQASPGHASAYHSPPKLLQDQPLNSSAELSGSHGVYKPGRPVAIIEKDEIQELEKLGEGAFGKVYKAIWRDRIVAVKKISGQLDSTLMAEIEILWRLRHPNVAEMLGVVDSNTAGEVTIVTEYYNGKSLYDILHGPSRVQLSLPEMLDLAIDVAKAMTYLHDFSITHRDIKSQNILLHKDGSVTSAVVCDFGVASTQTIKLATQIGTPNWMAPEIVVLNAKKGYDSKVDVYSYAMLLYEMMTNQIPFAGMNPIQIGFCLVRGERPMKPKKSERIPKELILLMTRCWAQEPEKRPSFDEIKGELKLIQTKYCSLSSSGGYKKFLFWPFKK